MANFSIHIKTALHLFILMVVVFFFTNVQAKTQILYPLQKLAQHLPLNPSLSLSLQTRKFLTLPSEIAIQLDKVFVLLVVSQNN
jgi:hypothetical protein